ncbi:hypothetical protein CAFE_28190 [Caprobacter fermentans]|uniref:Uncharacterized protein n=1 Tax=Caproicibacter fermentans TaxID=2576756 RepID=A0A6N8I2B7_9FIRM|nr:hypothetical protein [Caproicibacter fermentans]MVB12088.1 hypothetical protein [Caproicibacter fermentans]OCN02262.1 hypothetical protein A7X67_06340 [Clostridium sp. W14A]
MNSISGKRYKSLANSYAKTPRGRASQSERIDTCKAGQYAAASAERGVRRRNDNRIYAEKGRKTTAMALRSGRKGIHFITSIAAELGKRRPFPCGKRKGVAKTGSRAILPPKG